MARRMTRWTSPYMSALNGIEAAAGRVEYLGRRFNEVLSDPDSAARYATTLVYEAKRAISYGNLLLNQGQPVADVIRNLEAEQIRRKADDLAGRNGELRIVKPNTITIHQTDRGYSVEFPYKPNPNAIRGFHSLGMAWRSAGLDGRVVWSIPAGKIKDAIEFIEYWYSAKAEHGKPNYAVEVIAA